jgi:hypothetical protein
MRLIQRSLELEQPPLLGKRLHHYVNADIASCRNGRIV